MPASVRGSADVYNCTRYLNSESFGQPPSVLISTQLLLAMMHITALQQGPPLHHGGVNEGSSTSTGKALVFENSIQNADGHTNHNHHRDDTLHFRNDYDETSFSRNIDNTTSPHEADHKPLFLFLHRQGPTISVLSNPVTDEILYRVRQQERSHLSHGTDLAITRARSGGTPVGSIKCKHKLTQAKLDSTGQIYHDIDQFNPTRFLRDQTQNSTLVWITRTKKEKQPAKKCDWSKDDSAPSKLTLEITDILVLELIDQAQPDHPLCIVRLYDTQPTGRIEIWAPSACVDRLGGDWAVLDELVLSAYANMEKARLEMRRKMDRLIDGSSPAEMALHLLLALTPL